MEESGFWNEYRALVAQLYARPLSKRDGIPEMRLLRAEKRLGFRLPGALREFYRTAGKRDDLNCAFDQLLLPEELEVREGQLLFYEENQKVVVWGMEVGAAAGDDPLVYEAEPAEPIVWESTQGRLSDFLRMMAYWQGVNGGMRYSGIVVTNQQVLDEVLRLWPPVPLASQAWTDMRLLCRDGQVLCALEDAEGGIELFAAGRTKKEFLAIEKALGLEWDYCTLDDL